MTSFPPNELGISSDVSVDVPQNNLIPGSLTRKRAADSNPPEDERTAPKIARPRGSATSINSGDKLQEIQKESANKDKIPRVHDHGLRCCPVPVTFETLQELPSQAISIPSWSAKTDDSEAKIQRPLKRLGQVATPKLQAQYNSPLAKKRNNGHAFFEEVRSRVEAAILSDAEKEDLADEFLSMPFTRWRTVPWDRRKFVLDVLGLTQAEDLFKTVHDRNEQGSLTRGERMMFRAGYYRIDREVYQSLSAGKRQFMSDVVGIPDFGSSFPERSESQEQTVCRTTTAILELSVTLKIEENISCRNGGMGDPGMSDAFAIVRPSR